MKQHQLANDKKAMMISESHARRMLTNTALALAVIFGIFALYLCLVPALANDTARYIYFDNGISMYDTVEYSIDGKNYKPMYLLRDRPLLMPENKTNINPDYVWVTPEQIGSDYIWFKGTASGTVADSMSNYQINSASREWGYDYENFQWIAEKVSMDGGWNCYFAPAKAMQYKYNGQKTVDGQTITEYFIKPEPWAHANVANSYSLARGDAPLITVMTEEELAEAAAEEILLESEQPMEGTVGSVEDVSAAAESEAEAGPDTEETESDAAEDVTHSEEQLTEDAEAEDSAAEEAQLPEDEAAEAEESAAEEAEQPPEPEATESEADAAPAAELPEEEAIAEEEPDIAEAVAYAANDGIQVMANGTADAVLDASTLTKMDSLTYDLRVNDIFTIKANGEKTIKITDSRIELGGSGTKEYRSIQVNAARAGYLRVYANAGGDGRSLTLLNTNSVSEAVTTAAAPAAYDLPFNSSGTYYIASTYSGINIYSVELYYGNPNPFDDAAIRMRIGDYVVNSDPGDFTVSGTAYKNGLDGNYGDGSTADGSYSFMYNINLNDATGTISFTAAHEGEVRIFAAANGTPNDDTYLKLTASDGTVAAECDPAQIKGYHELQLITLYFSSPGTYSVSPATNNAIRIYAIGVYYTGGNIDPASNKNRFFSDYIYEMTGKTGNVNDVNDIGNRSQGANLEGSYATGSDPTHGLGDAYANAYKAKATFFDYYSDWELAGTPLNIDRYFYESTSSSDIDLYNKINYKAATDTSGSSHGTTKIDRGKNFPSEYFPITFSDGTNTVSYTYQGDLWNQAIRDYYADTDVKALYFGSNSWFTGNGRYDDASGHEPWATWRFGANEVMKSVDGHHVYNIPDEREYLYGLFAPIGKAGDIGSVFEDEFHGFSNSRAFEGWTLPNLSEADKYTLKTSGGQSVAYFDQAFIEGANKKNTVYGKVYENVDFDFKQDSDGYYHFDSTQTDYATRLTLMNGTANKYYMAYTGNGVTKADQTSETKYQFYPFNTPAANADFFRENLMFGMKLDIPFVTYQVTERRTGIFKFSGDDDVWVYIDGTLALDIGGTHTAVGGVIDMKTGYGVVQSTYDSATGGDAGVRTDAQEAAFAIGTLTRINNAEDLSSIEASFFDDTYAASGGYTSRIEDGLFKVTLHGNVTKNGNTVANANGVTYSFKLVDLREVLGITRPDAETETGVLDNLEEHTLTIYYMERGLNSSNLKISFKLPDLSQREVEKVWADGAEGHENDSVTVELYRTNGDDATDGVLANCDFESGTQGWYASGGNVAPSQEAHHQGSSSLKATNRTAEYQGPQFDLPKATYIPGQTYHFSAWAMYDGDSAHKLLYKSDFENSNIGDWKPRDFSQNNTNVDIWTSGAHKHSGEASLGVGRHTAQEGASKDYGGRTHPSEGVALELEKITLENGGSIQSGETYSFSVWVQDTDYKPNIPYKMSLQYNLPNVTENGKLKDQYSTISTVVETSGDNWYHLANPNYVIPENAINLLLYIETDNENYLDKFYIDDFVIATAGSTIDGTTVTNTSAGSASADAPTVFKMTLKYQDGTDTKYKNIASVTAEPGTWVHLDRSYTLPAIKGDSYHLIIETEPDGNCSDFYIDDVVIENDVIMTEVYRVGKRITLNSENDWKHLWDQIINSEEINGETVVYDYYIREVSVNIDGEDQLNTAYFATYFTTKDGKQLNPKTLLTNIDGNTERITAYPIDEEMYLTEIVNTPLVDLNVYKFWDGVATESQHPITINIYDDERTLVSSVELNAENGWSASLTGLPKYKRILGEDNKSRFEPITYYGVETNPGDFEVSYSSAKRMQINSRFAYAFTEVNDRDAKRQLALTVTNRDPDAPEFGFSLMKQSSAERAPLANVDFELYKLVDDSYQLIADGTTDQTGALTFGSGGFTAGTYKLAETRAAPGYRLNQTEIVFTVTEGNDGALTYEITSPKDNKFLTASEWEEGVLTFRLINDLYVIEMPSTGGGGIVWLFAASFGMIAISLVLLVLAERNNRRQDR